MSNYNQKIVAIIVLLLLVPPVISIADAGTKTTPNLCINCHGNRYGDYVTLSQFTVPSEVEINSTFTVTVRLTVSGNLDQTESDYWLVDADVTLSSSQGKFSFSSAIYSHTGLLPGDTVNISWQLTADQGLGIDTLQVSTFSIAQHEGRTGTDQLSAGIEVSPPNVAPQLSAPNFTPVEGDVNQIFGFEVTWSDADGDYPSYLRLILDGNSLPLNEVNPGVDNPISGVTYVSSNMTLGLGHHTYYFQGSDGINGARIPAGNEVTQGSQGTLTGVYSGPFVGGPPALSSESLSPLVGNNETNFTYSVILEFGDDMNGTHVTFWLDGFASVIIPEITDLGTTGTQYNFTTTLSSGINHFHYFTAVNRFGAIRYPSGTDSLSGPIIIGEVLSSASISPIQGNEKTVYNFSINYSNPAMIYPDSISVIIDETPIPLNLTTTGNWSEENQFVTETMLNAGNHSYYFLATEGGRTHRIPKQGYLQVNVARYDSDPWLDAGTIYVGGIEVFNNSSASLIGDIENISHPIILIGTEIEIRVTYFDAENDEAKANSMLAWIDGSPNIMQRLDGNNTSIGQVWFYLTPNLVIGTNHSVYFTAVSNYSASEIVSGVSIKYPILDNYLIPLPDVEAPPPPNVPPTIMPPTDGRMTLNPFAGSVEDNYTYLIEVVDPDWIDNRTLTVWLELDGNIHYLLPINGTDYRNGTVFGITLKISHGEHLHRFIVNDTEDEVAYPETDMLSGPTVQQNMMPIDELTSKPSFISWAWWLILLNSFLIIGGIGWGVRTFVEARDAVHLKEKRNIERSIRKFDENEKIQANELESNTEIWSFDSGDNNDLDIDTDELLSQLGDVELETSPMVDLEDLLEE